MKVLIDIYKYESILMNKIIEFIQSKDKILVLSNEFELPKRTIDLIKSFNLNIKLVQKNNPYYLYDIRKKDVGVDF